MPLFRPDPTFAALRPRQAKRPAWLPGRAPYVDPSPGFVTRNPLTGNLMLNGQRWRGVGANFGGSFGLSESNSAYGAPVVGGLHLASETEVDAAIATAKAMGHNMVRSFALLTVGTPLAIQPSLGVFPAENFEATDYAIWRCGQEGIKLVFPLVDNYRYFCGGKFDYCNAVGVTPDSVASQFYTDSTVRTAFKAHISAVLNHVNPRNGVAYRDDPTILAWETGNEMSVYPSAWTHSAWTADIATHIKTVCGARQLVMDGKYGVWQIGFDPLDTASMALENVDIYTWHANDQYRTPARMVEAADICHANGKAFIIGEFLWTGKRVGGWSLGWTLDQMIATVEGSGTIDGDMFWQLLPPLTNHGDGFALHYPGDTTDMAARATKLANHAAAVRGVAPPDPEPITPQGGHTVITIPGAFTLGYNVNNFGGTLFAGPNVRVPGSWNNWVLTNAAAVGDMNALDALIGAHINATPNRLIVAGHSRGGQIIYKWLREKAPTSTYPTNKLLFISSGNPERKYGGRCFLRPDAYPPVYPGSGGPGVGYGLPADLHGYQVLDIARQYDNWADYPNRWDNGAAMACINASDIHTAYSAAPELGLDGMPTDWADWTAYFESENVTYLTAPTYPLPMSADRPLSWLAELFRGRPIRQHQEQAVFRDAAQRRMIEAAYDRPASVNIMAVT